VKVTRLAFALTVILSACDAPPPPTPKPSAETTHPAWTLPPAAKRKLAEGASKLKAGDSYATVIAALGKPDEDDQEIPKGGTVSHGRLLHYRLSTYESGFTNLFHDENVYVDLDTKDVVRKITIHVTLTE